MKPKKSKPKTTTLHTETKAPPFFVRRFVGRKEAISHGTHSHHFFEVIFIEKGAGHQVIEGQSVKTKPGDVFVMAPGETHDPDGLDSTIHWIVAFDSSFLNKKNQSDKSLHTGLPSEIILMGFARPDGPLPLHLNFSKEQSKVWLERLHLASQEFNKKDLGYQEYTLSILNLLLIDIARVFAAQVKKPGSQKPTKKSHFFDILEENFRKDISLKDLAKKHGLSASYLTELIKKETGKSVMQWLVSRRIKEAQHMIRETHCSIKEAAYSVGYKDVSLFIRHFSKLVGSSPAQWKKGLS